MPTGAPALAASAARLGVGLDELVEVARGRAVDGSASVSSTDVGDPEERQPSVEEGRDGDLVGGVERARVRAAALAGARARARAAGTSRGRARSNSSVSPAARSSGGTGVAARSG